MWTPGRSPLSSSARPRPSPSGAASAGQLVASHDRHVFAVDGDCLYFSSTLAGANAPPAVVSVALPSQPQQVLISRTGSYLAVVGRKGVAVVLVGDAPKWNPTSASAIKAVNFMLPIPSWADVASASWHQMSESDSHIGVLLANRKAGTSAINLYDVRDRSDNVVTQIFDTTIRTADGVSLDPLDTPISLCFGPSTAGWSGLTAHVLTRGGQLLEICPIVPLSSHVAAPFIDALLDAARDDAAAASAATAHRRPGAVSTSSMTSSSAATFTSTFDASTPPTLPQTSSLSLSQKRNAVRALCFAEHLSSMRSLDRDAVAAPLVATLKGRLLAARPRVQGPLGIVSGREVRADASGLLLVEFARGRPVVVVAYEDGQVGVFSHQESAGPQWEEESITQLDAALSLPQRSSSGRYAAPPDADAPLSPTAALDLRAPPPPSLCLVEALILADDHVASPMYLTSDATWPGAFTVVRGASAWRVRLPWARLGPAALLARGADAAALRGHVVPITVVLSHVGHVLGCAVARNVVGSRVPATAFCLAAGEGPAALERFPLVEEEDDVIRDATDHVANLSFSRSSSQFASTLPLASFAVPQRPVIPRGKNASSAASTNQTASSAASSNEKEDEKERASILAQYRADVESQLASTLEAEAAAQSSFVAGIEERSAANAARLAQLSAHVANLESSHVAINDKLDAVLRRQSNVLERCRRALQIAVETYYEQLSPAERAFKKEVEAKVGHVRKMEEREHVLQRRVKEMAEAQGAYDARRAAVAPVDLSQRQLEPILASLQQLQVMGADLRARMEKIATAPARAEIDV